MGYIEPTEAEQAARQQTLQEIAQAVVGSMSVEVARVAAASTGQSGRTAGSRPLRVRRRERPVRAADAAHPDGSAAAVAGSDVGCVPGA